MKTLLSLIALTAVNLHLSAAARAEDYIAHEWGTFTSVQGANGVQMAWNPLSVSELPGFVYDANRTNGITANRLLDQLAGKSLFQTLQRMETPVVYFYSERPQKVDVSVKFPQGIITEWYPQIAPWTASKIPGVGPSTIRWKDVQVLPRARHGQLAGLLPQDPSGSHYYAARETDADFLQVSSQKRLDTPASLGTLEHGLNAGGNFGCSGADLSSALETEKFLFYRGVGNFRAPLTVTQDGENAETVTLQNTGGDELRHLFVYSVRGNRAKLEFVSELAPGAKRSVTLAPLESQAPLSEVRARLAAEMVEALVSEGLYRPEAQAMVKTWDDSWFAEQGVRVLYTLPRVWTDRILPLTLDPKPREIARVMVGRAELITPSMEWDLMRHIVRYSEALPGARSQIVDQTRDLGLGRFLEPVARSLQSRFGHTQLRKAGDELIHLAAKPAGGKSLAAK